MERERSIVHGLKKALQGVLYKNVKSQCNLYRLGLGRLKASGLKGNNIFQKFSTVAIITVFSKSVPDLQYGKK